MGLEYELKFAASEAQLHTLLARHPEAVSVAMETTYFDTPDGALGKRRWTLRRRFENGVSVCTFKTADTGVGRGEWETECDEILKAIPVLCRLGAPEVLAELTHGGVAPTCGAKFTRRAALISLENAEVELAMDEGILLGGEKTLPFREIEVELKRGTPADADAYAAALAEELGLEVQPKSKFRRALELAEGVT